MRPSVCWLLALVMGLIASGCADSKDSPKAPTAEQKKASDDQMKKLVERGQKAQNAQKKRK